MKLIGLALLLTMLIGTIADDCLPDAPVYNFDKYCQNGGSCNKNQTLNKWTSSCLDKFYGKHCEYFQLFCSSPLLNTTFSIEGDAKIKLCQLFLNDPLFKNVSLFKEAARFIECDVTLKAVGTVNFYPIETTTPTELTVSTPLTSSTSTISSTSVTPSSSPVEPCPKCDDKWNKLLECRNLKNEHPMNKAAICF